MVLPVTCTAAAGVPARSRCSALPAVAAQCTSATAPITNRLISSGIARSCERSPASTCTTGMPRWWAACAPALAELVSPCTTTASGRSERNQSVNPVSIAAS